MSVVLAFGLSPIGQGQAYAAKAPVEQPAAQQEQALSPQAVEVDATWQAVADSLTYNGKQQKLNFTTLKATAGGATYNFLNDDPAVYTVTYYALDDAGKKVPPKDLTGEDLTDQTEGVYTAGDYVATISATVDFSATLADVEVSYDFPFTVAPLDISAASSKVVPKYGATYTANGNGLLYTGTTQNVMVTTDDDDDETGGALAAKGTKVTVTLEDESTEDVAMDYGTGFEITTDASGVLQTTVIEPGTHKIPIKGVGNFTGTTTVNVVVHKATLATDAVLINGVEATKSSTGDGNISFKEQAVGDAASPVESVVIGSKTLAEGTDYKVTYVKKLDGDGLAVTGDQPVLTEHPTEAGSYEVTITGIGTSAYLDELGTLYGASASESSPLNNIVVPKNLFKVSTTLEQTTFKALGVVKATVPSVTYNGKAQSAKGSVRFYDAMGNDLTDKVGDNYTLAYRPWTDLEEQVYLGALYSDTYVSKLADGTTTPKASGDYSVLITSGSGDDTLGATIENDAQSGEEYVSGSPIKFQIEPAKVVSGDAVGQVKVTGADAWSKAATETGAIFFGGADVTYDTLKGAKPLTLAYKVSNETTGNTEAIEIDGTKVKVAFAKADGSESGTKTKGAAYDAGTYDATITFDGAKGDFDGEIKLAGGLVVNKFDISEQTVTFGDLPYTGEAYGVQLPTGWGDGSASALGKVTADDLSWTVLPATVKQVLSTYKVMSLTATGNYTGTIKKETANEEIATLAVEALEMSADTVQVQMRNAGDAEWTDASSTTALFGMLPGTVVSKDNVRVVLLDDQKKATDKVLNAAEYDIEVLYDGKELKEGETPATGAKGTVAVTPAEGSSVTLASGAEIVGNFVIASQSLKDFSVSVENATYNGQNQVPALKVVDAAGNEVGTNFWTATVTKASEKDDEDAVAADWAAVSAKNPEEAYKDYFLHADTYTFTVSAVKGNSMFAGSIEGDYTISPKTFAQSDVYDKAGRTTTGVVIAPWTAEAYEANDYNPAFMPLTYTTKEQEYKAAPEYYIDGEAVADDLAEYDADLEQKAYYKVSGNKQTDVGVYEATFEFGGDYSGTVTQKFEIAALELDDLDMYLDGVYAYSFKGYDFDGTAKEPVVTFYAGETLVIPADFDGMRVQYDDNANAGDRAKVTVEVNKGNFQGKTSANFRINAVSLADEKVTVTPDEASLFYTGSAVTPKFTLAMGDYTLVEGTDYLVKEQTAGVRVGDKISVMIEPKIDGNFDAAPYSRTLEFEVAPVDLGKAKVALSKTSFTYSGKVQKPTVKSVAVGDTAVATGLYTATVPSSKNAGTYTVKVAGDGSNVIGEATATYKIAQAKNTKFKVTAKKKSYAAKAKKATSLAAKNLYKVTGKAGKVTYKKANTVGGKKIVVASNGKITVKKGLKAGTYKVKVKATSKANTNYKAASANVTIAVKVK